MLPINNNVDRTKPVGNSLVMNSDVSGELRQLWLTIYPTWIMMVGKK